MQSGCKTEDVEDVEDVIDVNTGEAKIATGQVTLRAIAIGSCIAVAAYNSRRKTGAMAHIMLPGRAPENAADKTKYAANAIEQLLSEMTDGQSQGSDIEVCLVGAGNVLQRGDDAICRSNIKSVTGILAEKNIPVKASVLGGRERRTVFLDVENGCVSYTVGDKSERILHRSTGGDMPE